MEKIMSLLVVPNLDAPINNEAANDFKNGTWEKKAQ
jgi:ubiquitin-protein ligase